MHASRIAPSRFILRLNSQTNIFPSVLGSGRDPTEQGGVVGNYCSTMSLVVGEFKSLDEVSNRVPRGLC